MEFHVAYDVEKPQKSNKSVEFVCFSVLSCQCHKMGSKSVLINVLLALYKHEKKLG